MVKVLFVCHGNTEDSRDSSALVGQKGKSAAFGTVRYYGFATSEKTKKYQKTDF